MKKFLAVLAGIGAVLAFLAGWFFRDLSGRKNSVSASHEIYEEEKHAIENTPAADLVDSAPNAGELRSNAAGIAEQAKQRFRDRVGTILSGYGTDADNGGGGRGD